MVGAPIGGLNDSGVDLLTAKVAGVTLLLKSLSRCGFEPSAFIVHQSVPRDELSALLIHRT